MQRTGRKMDAPFLMLMMGMVTATLVAAILWLTTLMFSRYEYQKGVNALAMKQYDSAWTSLTAAQKILPDTLANLLAQRDLFRIYSGLGETLYHQALVEKRRASAFEKLEKGYGYIRSAAEIAPSSYMANYWLARLTAKLEYLFSLIHKREKNPYNALTRYQAAAHLRPYGVTVHYEMVRYMASRKIFNGFEELVAYTAQIFPGVYGYLKKEPFYSPELRNKIKEGVLRAAELNITPRTTYGVLSAMYQEEKDFEKAAFYYGESLRFNPSSNNSNSFLHLGALFMQMKDGEQAKDIYLKALKQSQDFKGTVNRIYRDYKKFDNLEGFMVMAQTIGEHFHSQESLDLAMAMCRMDMGLYELARAILIRREATAPSAEVYNLMAQVASKLKDWDQMELASQRATVVEPGNLANWRLFSAALKNQKKFAQAREVDAKIKELSANRQ